MQRRVVVTGMGVVTAIGNSVKEYWEGLLAGRSGSDYITHFDASEHTTKFGCEVKNFSAEGVLDPRETKRMDLFTQYAMVATKEAMADSSIDPEKIHNPLTYKLPYQKPIVNHYEMRNLAHEAYAGGRIDDEYISQIKKDQGVF